MIQNKENLKKIINELIVLFSEEDLKKLSDYYNKGFESSISILGNYSTSNKYLAKNYFDELTGIILNSSKVQEILFEYMNGALPYKREQDPFDENHYVYLKEHNETIENRKLTQGYLNKFDIFKNNFENSVSYIRNSLFLDYLNEYKNLIIKLKKLLQTIKKTKISNLYPDFNDLKFTDENIEKIDLLYIRLNKYFSDDIFNQNYISHINYFKEQELNELDEEVKNYIEEANNNITYSETISDIINDFCYSFKTKAYYTCTNGLLSYYVNSSDNYCLHLINSQNSENIKDISIYKVEDIKYFISEFNKFYSSIEEKVNLYDSIMNELKIILLSAKNETIEQKFTENYLLSFENTINTILTEKYGDNIILGSYDYYKNDTKSKIEEIISNISNKWESIYDSLNNEIKENKSNLKSGTYEFGIIAQVISILINGNITRNFYNSIVTHQKNEFSYSISYYFNFLLRLIKSAYKYLLSSIPINQNGFNDIIDLRKTEINNYFNNLIAKINELKEKSCLSTNQIEVLQINEKNFFGINIILSENIKNMNDSLSLKAKYPYMFYLENNEYSFINRFYLENSEIGKQIKEYYKEIEQRDFIKLKRDIYLNLIEDNLIFDQKELNNKIEALIYNSNSKIDNLIEKEKKDYISDLESLVTEFFTKDSIIEEINRLYKSEVKEMEQNEIEEINKNINEILNKIKEKLSNETLRLQTTAVSYNKDYTNIENTLNEYKNEIFDRLNTTVLNVLKDFHKNITEKLLKNYIEPMFGEFLNKATEFTQNFQEIQTLNKTYKINNIILDIIKDFSIEYRNITEIQIEHKYKEYQEEITNKLGLIQLKNKINKEIEDEYNSTLLPALENYAIHNIGDSGYTAYDFSKEIKDEIGEVINSKINNINNIVLTSKGNSFKINFISWSAGFDDNGIYYEIENKFKNFMSIETKDEIENFNNDVKIILESNFKELISEIISSFGNDFFDRIIKYNENFKITGLYNNLKYSLFQAISYYIMINMVEAVDELPKDLKVKLYNLNNLDLIAKDKNKKVLDLLEGNINEFIQKSKDEILSLFIENIDRRIVKENNFIKKVSDIISSQLNDMRDNNEISNYYTNLLKDSFKSKFITSYTNIMNKELEELIELINDQKEQLKVEIDYCFTLDPEDVLNDINNKLNITLDLVNEYNDNYYDGFNISENFQNYLNNYGNEIIKPIYANLINIIDESSKDIIASNINKNIKNYEDKLNIIQFNDLSNNTYLLTKEIFEKIKKYIDIYGLNDYNNKLDNEIERIESINLRRLNGEITEKDENEEKNNKNVFDIFRELIGYSENTTIFINSFEEFNKFKDIISNEFSNLDKSFKKSKEQIIKNNYEEDIKNYLFGKLYYIKNITANYYNSINDTFYEIKDYLVNSILDLNNLLNECENITYIAFSEKYQSISKEVKNLDKDYNTMEENLIPIIYNSTWENNNIKTTAKFEKLIKKAKFKYFYNYEKGSSPIMRVELIDEGKPEKLNLEIEESYGDCGKKIQEIEAEFRNVSFITYIDYNIATNKINMTTITNFESYDYTIVKYKKDVSSGQQCRNIMGLTVCTGGDGCKEVGPRTHKEENQESVYEVNTVFLDA